MLMIDAADVNHVLFLDDSSIDTLSNLTTPQ